MRSGSDIGAAAHRPLVIMFERPDGGGTECRLHPGAGCDKYMTYGMLIADLVRHVARAFKVKEDAVWEWVDKERRNPTDAVETVKGFEQDRGR